MQSSATVLLTGFEPFAGMDVNPSQRLVEAFDTRRYGAYRLHGEVLPVALDGQAERVGRLIERVDPTIMVCLGLASGSACLRLERCAMNLADFAITDNNGALCHAEPLAPDGPAALMATLPLERLRAALLTAGIPVQTSNSAGTYLCNALSYQALYYLMTEKRAVACGFIHLPLLPEQVAGALAAGSRSANTDDQHGLASMAYETQVAALDCILTELCVAPT